MAKKSPKKISKKERNWYIFASIVATIGLLFLIFGIIGDHFPGNYADNWVASSENGWLKNWSKLGYRYWGLILLGIGALVAIISLTVFAKEGDRDAERAARKAQRLGLASTPEVTEVETKDVE